MYKLIRSIPYKQSRDVRCVSIWDVDPCNPCSICLNRFDHNPPTPIHRRYVKRLPCGHTFHIRCIDRWLLEHITCPVCRQHCFHREEIPAPEYYTVFFTSPLWLNLEPLWG